LAIADQGQINALFSHIRKLDFLCENLGAEFTRDEIKRIKDRLESRYKPTWDDVLTSFTDINGRMRDEFNNAKRSPAAESTNVVLSPHPVSDWQPLQSAQEGGLRPARLACQLHMLDARHKLLE
jgi:hypothetical protein